jgi:hypothetical protein
MEMQVWTVARLGSRMVEVIVIMFCKGVAHFLNTYLRNLEQSLAPIASTCDYL